MKSVTFVTCECGSLVEPMLLELPATNEGLSVALEGICPNCLLEIQVGLAAKKTTVPADLRGL